MKKVIVQTGLVLLLGTLFLISCSPRSSPPGPSSATGVIEDAGYAFHVWQDGLRILILHNTPNAFFCQGEGGSSSPVYHLECDTESLDGRKLSWEIETGDGTRAQVAIGSETYAVSGDTVFILRSEGSGVQVQQISRDLSQIPFDNDGIVEFVKNDPELSVFLNTLLQP